MKKFKYNYFSFKNNKFNVKLVNLVKVDNPNFSYLLPISVILFLNISKSKNQILNKKL